MVTGAYYPEVSGAANQCRQLVNELRGKVNFMVLTTSRDHNLSPRCQVDGVDVFRLLLNTKNVWSYCGAILELTTFFLFQRKDFQVVHLHGFSAKSILLVLLSKLFNKKIIIKMTSIEHDDPLAMEKRGFFLNWFYSRANAYVGTSQQFKNIYQKNSYLPEERFMLIPNGVDTESFCSVSNREKRRLRQQLGLPLELKIILFIGHFSKDKNPDILINIWKDSVVNVYPDSGIVFVGRTSPDHYEVDVDIVKEVKRLAKPYQDKRIFFVEKTHDIEKYYQASDIFVMPSLREGLPNAMLEAMSCELPVILSKLETLTEWVVEDGLNGFLFPPGNEVELSEKLILVLSNSDLSIALGKRARKTILERFSMNTVAGLYRELYRRLIPLA